MIPAAHNANKQSKTIDEIYITKGLVKERSGYLEFDSPLGCATDHRLGWAAFLLESFLGIQYIPQLLSFCTRLWYSDPRDHQLYQKQLLQTFESAGIELICGPLTSLINRHVA